LIELPLAETNEPFIDYQVYETKNKVGRAAKIKTTYAKYLQNKINDLWNQWIASA
jgi:hypothetical protein